MSYQLAVIILAAGKGKRMLNPDLPKVLAQLDHKPLIDYVLNLTNKLSPKRIVVVVGFHKEQVIEHVHSLGQEKVEYAIQHEQLGTGHAVMSAREKLENFDGDILILAGDVPMIRYSTIKKFINLHIEALSKVSVLSTIAPDPIGYGRIIRDENDNFLCIVEEKDADDGQKFINEINSGIFLVNSRLLFSSLEKIGNRNAQNEYYLTDIIKVIRDWGYPVHAINCSDFAELQGINTIQDLTQAEQIIKHFQLIED